jgi:hypothetical protein
MVPPEDSRRLTGSPLPADQHPAPHQQQGGDHSQRVGIGQHEDEGMGKKDGGHGTAATVAAFRRSLSR